MNRVFRVVWRAASQSWVVASELATGKKKSALGRVKKCSVKTMLPTPLASAIGLSLLMGGLPMTQAQVLDWTGAAGNGEYHDSRNWAQNQSPTYGDSINVNTLPKLNLRWSSFDFEQLNIGTVAGSEGHVEVWESDIYAQTLQVGAGGGVGTMTAHNTDMEHRSWYSEGFFHLGSGSNSQGTINALGTGKSAIHDYHTGLMLEGYTDGANEFEFIVGIDQGRGTINIDGGAFATNRYVTRLGSGSGSFGSINILAGGKFTTNADSYLEKTGLILGYAGGEGRLTLNEGTGDKRNVANLFSGISLGQGSGSLGYVNVLSGGKVTSYAADDYDNDVLLHSALGVDGGTGKVRLEGTGATWLVGGVRWEDGARAIGELHLAPSGTGVLTLVNDSELFVGRVDEQWSERLEFIPVYDELGAIYMATSSDAIGIINFGNDPDEQIGGGGVGRLVAEKIVLGQGSAWINFNHNQDLKYSAIAPVFDTSSQGSGTLNLGSYAGVTRLDLAQPNFSGFTDIYGGTLVVEDANALGASVIRGRLHAGVPEGGTLQYSNGLNLANAIELFADAKLGLRVQSGETAVHSGAISGDGHLRKEGEGTLELTGAASYTGTTYIDEGTLKLAANTQLADSQEVVANGTLDISAHNSTAQLKTLSGDGAVALGANTLEITAGSSNGQDSGLFSGDISGSGGLLVSGGNQRLGGTNNYSGVTQINAGATLTLEGNGHLKNSAEVKADGTLAVADHADAATIKTLSGAGRVELASDNSLNITAGGSNGAGSGTFAGVIDGAGGIIISGGEQELTAANSYQGNTQIDTGATLKLSGASDISSSSGVKADGTLDIAAHSGPAAVQSLAGAGRVALGSNDLQITNAENSADSNLFSGDIAGAGGLTVSGGNQRLSGNTSFTGVTQINSGATLTLEGASQLANSAEVKADGTLAVSDHSGAASIKTLSGNGRVALAGGNSLSITDAGSNGAGSGTFAGVIEGAGDLTINAGTQELSGTNSYSGVTQIDSGATLALTGQGQISQSSTVLANGVLDISGHTTDALIQSLAGSGQVILGASNLDITAAGNAGTQSGLFSGSIKGAGGLVVSGGTQYLGGTNDYQGTTTVLNRAVLGAAKANSFSAASVHTVLEGGSLLLNAFSQQVAGLYNAGLVSLNEPTATSTFRRTAWSPATLTVANDYQAQNGTLVLRTQLGGDNSLTDKLIVNGNTSGTTQVLVRNAGGVGADTIKGIEIIQVDGMSQGAFTLAAPVQAGAFEYELFQGNADDPSNGNWYLSSSGFEPGPCPEGMPGPCAGGGSGSGGGGSGGGSGGGEKPEPNYRSEVANVVAAQSANMEQGMTMLSTLHQRIGGAYNLQSGERLGWIRAYNDNDRSEGDRFNYDQRISGLQMGHDLWVSHDGNGTSQRAGIALDYTNGSADFEDQVRASRGKSKDTGDMDTDIFSAGAYYTIADQEGAYFDSLLMISKLENDYKDIYGDKGTQKGWRAGLSVEVGKPVARFAQNWSVEPQAQLSYQYSRYKSFDDEVSEIDSYDVNTVRGRVGVRLRNESHVQDKPAQAYVIANVVHDFLKPTEVDFLGTKVRDKYDQTSYEVGVGGRIALGANTTLFGDGRYRKSFGGDTQSTVVNLGVQVRF